MISSIYNSQHKWTVVFIVIAIIIVITTVLVSNSFSEKIAQEERARGQIWAEATTIIASGGVDSLESATMNINLILNIIESNNSIPVILCTEHDSIISFNNISLPENDVDDFLQKKIVSFKGENPPIIIEMGEEKQYLYYDESLVLKRLMIYPYIQIAVVFIFILISFFALVSAKKAEQNKVWIGLSKETAHQLGTPISSLIAWIEYLKTKEVDNKFLNEMGKDINRLETITERFSKIGSEPDYKKTDINEALKSSCDYISSRISSKVNITINYAKEPVYVQIIEPLFSWVIENLTKNAVDSMEGVGSITYLITESKKKVYIDVTDTGKGIPKSKFKTIFNPGYTTKKRGWGLGLSLTKRIMESFKGGKVYVKSSETGKGTTFRIELRRYN
jgi:signal transduction histidine kinase